MNRKWNLAVAALALLVAPIAAGGQTGQRTPPAVLLTLTQAEARATGVAKLTDAERSRLEAWIARLTSNVSAMAVAAQCAPAPVQVSMGVIETRISGDFTGWDGASVYALDNGQVWQQVSFDRAAVYLARPRVTLVSSGSEWRMSVEGIAQTVPVRRLR